MYLLWTVVTMMYALALLYKYRSFSSRIVRFLKQNKKLETIINYIKGPHKNDNFIKSVINFVIGKENVAKNIRLNEVILNQWIYYYLPIICFLPQILIYSFNLKNESLSTGLLFSVLFSLVIQFFTYIYILGKLKTYETNLRYRITNLVDILVKITVIAGLFSSLIQHDKAIGEYLLWLILISTSLISYQGALKYHFDVIDKKNPLTIK